MPYSIILKIFIAHCKVPIKLYMISSLSMNLPLETRRFYLFSPILFLLNIAMSLSDKKVYQDVAQRICQLLPNFPCYIVACLELALVWGWGKAWVKEVNLVKYGTYKKQASARQKNSLDNAPLNKQLQHDNYCGHCLTDEHDMLWLEPANAISRTIQTIVSPHALPLFALES